MRITKDGTYHINEDDRAGRVTILVAGKFGAATVNFSVPDGFGNMVTLQDGEAEEDSQYVVSIGAENELYAVVTGADKATNFSIQVGSLR